MSKLYTAILSTSPLGLAALENNPGIAKHGLLYITACASVRSGMEDALRVDSMVFETDEDLNSMANQLMLSAAQGNPLNVPVIFTRAQGMYLLKNNEHFQ